MPAWKFFNTLVVGAVALGVIAAPGCSSSDDKDATVMGPTDPLNPRAYKLGELSNACDPSDRNAQCAELADDAVPVDDEAALGIDSAEDDASTETETDDQVQDERRKKSHSHGPILEKKRARRGKKIVVELKLKPGSRLADKLVPGKVLVRTRKDRKPMARRILAVERNGDTFRVAAEVVSMREAFRAARLAGKVHVNSAEVRAQGGGPTTKTLHPLGPGGIDKGFDCGFALPVNFAGVTGEIGLRECNVAIDFDVDFVDQWGGIWPNSGDYFELKVTGNLDAGATAYLEIEAALNTSSEKKVLGVNIATPIPGLLIAVELWGGYDIDLNAKLTASTGFDYADSVTAGVGFEVGRGFYDIWENPKSKFTNRPPMFNFIGTLHGGVYIEPRIGLSALGLAEATVALRASADLEVTSTITGSAKATPVEANICYDLKASLQPGVTAGLTGIARDVASVFGLDSEATYYLPGLSTTLLNDCITSQQAPGSSCDASSDCFTDSGCTEGTDACNVGICEVPQAATRCLCRKTRVADCCLTDTDCSSWWMGNDPLPASKHWDCFQNKCVARFGGTFSEQIAKESEATPINECFGDAGCDDELSTTEDHCLSADATHAGKFCTHIRALGAAAQQATTKAPYSLDASPTSADSCTNDSCLDNDLATVNTCSRTTGCITSAPLTGFCGGKLTCDDGDPATTDSCVNSACVHTKILAMTNKQPGGMIAVFGKPSK